MQSPQVETTHGDRGHKKCKYTMSKTPGRQRPGRNEYGNPPHCQNLRAQGRAMSNEISLRMVGALTEFRSMVRRDATYSLWEQ